MQTNEFIKSKSQKRKFVKRMFDDISGKYDFMNRLISFGMDSRWRRQTIKPHENNKLVLDICSGTGDMAKELLRRPGFDGFIVLGDFSSEMHKLAKRKLAGHDNIFFVNCDAENLPFKDNTYDGIISGYSLRNLTNLNKLGRELERVMSKGGQASILDMAHPPNKFLGRLFHIYFYKMVPWFSRYFTSREYAYRYLPVSLRTFLKQPEVINKIKGEKLAGEYKNVFGGIVAIYRLRK